MVSDVRQKVGMRLQALIARLADHLRNDVGERILVGKAQIDESAALIVRAKYRSHVVREFPGCRITFTRQRVSIRLPERYPRSYIPIEEPLPPALIECFSPRAYLAQPEIGA